MSIQLYGSLTNSKLVFYKIFLFINFKDGDLNLTNGPIQAADLDVYLDEAVKYELEMSRPEANMFNINPDSGEISAKSNFDANLLSDAKLLTLNLKVQN